MNGGNDMVTALVFLGSRVRVCCYGWNAICEDGIDRKQVANLHMHPGSTLECDGGSDLNYRSLTDRIPVEGAPDLDR